MCSNVLVKYKLDKDKQVARLLTAKDIRVAFEVARGLEAGYVSESFLKRMIDELKLYKETKDKTDV